jgi:hypothetical protein
MYLAFIDDVKQSKPTRPGMGPLVGVGALLVPCEVLLQLEHGLYQLGVDSQFPVNDHKGSEFKWSPGKELWIKENLTGTAREEFLLNVVRSLHRHKATLIVVLEDRKYDVADSASTNHEIDVTRLLFERINHFLAAAKENAVVVHDRPSGGRGDENDFLTASIEMLREGTRFVNFDRIALNPLCTQSRFVRLLQAADVAIGCVAAYVSGEEKYSPVVFSSLLPLFNKGPKRIGGFGLKIHPEHIYVNLYHWLLGDTTNSGEPLPRIRKPHAEKPAHIAACELWKKVAAKVKTMRPLIHGWVEIAHPYRLENGALLLFFQPEEQLAAASLFRSNNFKFVTSLLAEIAGSVVELKYELLQRGK